MNRDDDNTQSHITLTKGTMVSHYRIVEKIGAGGMGEVYLAEDTKLNRQVALKFIPVQYASDQNLRERFSREAQAAAKLDHPNIVPVYEVGEYNGRPFFAMAHIEGKSLRETIKVGKLGINEAVEFTMQICEGLQEAHDAGVVHRDIKPGNIVIDTKGKPRLLDFGLAIVSGEEKLTKTGSTLGTVGYMSPEQINGKSVDRRSDLFSVGVILYEMLTGRRPFEGDTDAAIVRAITDGTPEPVARFKSGVTGQLQQIIDKALTKDPSIRYQHADDILADLKRLSIESGEVNKSRLGLWVAATIIIVVGGYFVLDEFRLLEKLGISKMTETDRRNSIAVLLFQNLSPDPDNEYFSAGISEELISKLSRIQNLQVASLTRSKGTKNDIKEICKKLGVRYLLDGSVRKTGNRVRITAQLIDASTGFLLWSDDFEGELKDVFALQEKTALKIAAALDLRLSPQEAEAVRHHYTENLQAYDAYLRGWTLVESFHVSLDVPEGRLEAARKHFEAALASDSNYALALAGLSMVEAHYHWFDIDTTSHRLQRAEELAQRALNLDPQLSEAHLALGEVYGFGGYFGRAIDEYKKGLRRDPDDPNNAYVWCHLAYACNQQHPPDPESAEEASRNAIRLQPGYFFSYTMLGWALELQERYEEALVAYEYAFQLNPALIPPRQLYVSLGKRHLTSRDYNQALARFETARQMLEDAALLVQISAAYAALGDKEKSLGELEKALAAGYHDISYLDTSSHFASLRFDPRFKKMLKTNGLE